VTIPPTIASPARIQAIGTAIPAAINALLMSDDPEVCDKAARAWCAWEDRLATHAGPVQPHPRSADPRRLLGFARLVTHYFRCLSKGYRGWRWAVTVARASRARTATVCEVVLLPGQESVLAPAWLPWSDRIAPGDLGAADQLAYRADDPYLEPGYLATGDEDADRMAIWEFGLGRPRVLSPFGRAELAQRWYGSDRGPTSDEAVHAAAACSTCGYFLPLAGSLRQVFGVCGNEWSPSDARVVSVDHGCGAHSETDLERVAAEALPPPILDETGFEAVVLPPKQTPEAEAVDPEPVVAEPVEAEPAEPEPVEPELVAPEPVGPELVASEPVAPEAVEQEPVSAE